MVISTIGRPRKSRTGAASERARHDTESARTAATNAARAAAAARVGHMLVVYSAAKAADWADSARLKNYGRSRVARRPRRQQWPGGRSHNPRAEPTRS